MALVRLDDSLHQLVSDHVLVPELDKTDVVDAREDLPHLDQTGRLLAREIDVRPNRPNALFEADVLTGTTELERAWLRDRMAFEPGANGQVTRIGEVSDSGVRVDRVRRLVNRLAPPYVSRDAVRVYDIDNKEWNAMAMGNGAIWVFSGIMDDMNDDELAVVVGHELAHYTHEHSRRQARRGIWTQLGGLSAILSAEAIDNKVLRAGAQLGAAAGRKRCRETASGQRRPTHHASPRHLLHRALIAGPRS